MPRRNLCVSRLSQEQKIPGQGVIVQKLYSQCRFGQFRRGRIDAYRRLECRFLRNILIMIFKLTGSYEEHNPWALSRPSSIWDGGVNIFHVMRICVTFLTYLLLIP